MNEKDLMKIFMTRIRSPFKYDMIDGHGNIILMYFSLTNKSKFFKEAIENEINLVNNVNCRNEK